MQYGKKNRETEKGSIRKEKQYELGEAAEFDWGEVKLTLDGKEKIIQMALFTTAKGDYREGDLYHSHKSENFSDCHASFFEEVGGVYKEIVYDNSRVAVRKFVGRTKKEPTEVLLKLSIYYGFSFRFCNNYQAHEKGHVERSIEYVRRKIFSKKDSFSSLEEARAYFREGLKRLNAKPQPERDKKSAQEILKEEQDYLLALPPRYDTARPAELRVDKYSTVTVDSCHYSVPDSLVGRFVFTKVYPYRVISYHEGKKVSCHQRRHGRHQWSIDISHYLTTLKKKPGALKRSAALSQAKPALRQIYKKYYKGEEKAFIELLELMPKHGLDRIEEAILALEKINPRLVDTEKIKTIVQRNDVETGENIAQDSSRDIHKKSKEIMGAYSEMLSGVVASER